MKNNQLSLMGLVNDNFVGYLDPWIYQNDITWMEKTVATPFWTGMTLFSIDRKATHQRQKHNLLDTIYEGRGRVLFKGQLFSAPMDWPGLLQQLERAAQEEALVALPVQGAILAARVRVTIAAGFVDLNKLLRQATVRRNVVEQLLRMRKDAGHPDYQNVDTKEVQRRTRQLATTDEPEIPSGLVEFLNAEDEVAEEFFQESTRPRHPRNVRTPRAIYRDIWTAHVRKRSSHSGIPMRSVMCSQVGRVRYPSFPHCRCRRERISSRSSRTITYPASSVRLYLERSVVPTSQATRTGADIMTIRHTSVWTCIRP
ncbi:hypothetical protein N9L19_00635 [bacterium]|nr:hypothetical protein [bacterium]